MTQSERDEDGEVIKVEVCQTAYKHALGISNDRLVAAKKAVKDGQTRVVYRTSSSAARCAIV